MFEVDRFVQDCHAGAVNGRAHLVERSYDVDKTLALFEESNRLYRPP
jgi:hypothetical protein